MGATVDPTNVAPPTDDGRVGVRAPGVPTAVNPRTRVVALDWMRGLVMVLMAIDHSSGEFNAGRIFSDGAFLYKPGTALPAAQFLTRWITHLCAPTFVFLAGTSLAFSIRRRIHAGESSLSIDRRLLVRGIFIMGLELVPSYFWMDRGRVLLQVLYAIGSSFLLMIPLRRLPIPALVGLAVGIAAFGEAAIGLAGWGPPEKTPLVAALLLVPGPHGPLLVAYPTLEWLAIMLFGWAFGVHLEKISDSKIIERHLAWAGFLSLVLFALVRGANGYGNMRLFRDGGAVVQWLHVSKYPPSFSFVTLELGLSCVILSAVMRLSRRAPPPRTSPFLLLGRTPMFFYLLHIPLLALTARALSVEHGLGLGAAYLFGILVVAVLYLPCRWYGRYKAAHPDGLAGYV
jgi:uncharacterized membrane protein